MTTIYIKKTDFGAWQWNESLNGGYIWHTFSSNIKTPSDMMAFFRGGGHRGQRGARFDAPALVLVDDNNQVQKYYKVKVGAGIHSAVIDFDDNKRKSFITADLWPEADQLQYLKTAAVHLPEDIDTVKDAVEYLGTNEPFTIEQFNETLTTKIKDGIAAQCQQHAAGTPAVVEFI